MPAGTGPSAIDKALPPDLTERFAADLFSLWPEGKGGMARLGVAVSGGPDSLALLVLAVSALAGRVEAATVDHGLRAESAEEAAMVARTCAALGVPHETLGVTVAPGSMQLRAREARYAALGEWCERRGLAAVATGHQLDDQAETVLMRLNRGSGLAGLAGVRARGVIPGGVLPLLRPVLGWRRGELAAVASLGGLEPAQDASNDDTRFDRVRMREALAAADWLDPNMLARSAALLGEAEAYVRDRIDAVFAERVSVVGGEARLLPGSSNFEAVELAGRIIARFGGIATRGELAALVARLSRGENASLAGVLVRTEGGVWVFAAEPSRRKV